MIGEDYNEKAQKMKIKMQEFIVAEYKYINSRAKYIDSLIEILKDSDSDHRIEILNLKKDNEDSKVVLFSFEDMLKNRLTADGIARFADLFQGYTVFSDAISKDLEKFNDLKD